MSVGDSHGLCVSILGGTVGMQREFGMPFQLDLVVGAERVGYRNEDTATVAASYPDLPPFLQDRGPATAAFSGEDLVIGLGLYTAPKVSDAVAGDLAFVCTTRWGGLRSRSFGQGCRVPSAAARDRWNLPPSPSTGLTIRTS